MITYKILLEALNKLPEDQLNKPAVVILGGSGSVHYCHLRLLEEVFHNYNSGGLTLDPPTPVIYTDAWGL